MGLTANALNSPPVDYDRKVETQGNWREFLQVVEHVVQYDSTRKILPARAGTTWYFRFQSFQD